MATIPVRSSAKVFTIDNFLGLNESADGDGGSDRSDPESDLRQ